MEFVRVKSSKRVEGYVTLAKPDFDPAVHELFEGPETQDPSPEPAAGATPVATTSAPATPGAPPPPEPVVASVADMKVPDAIEAIKAANVDTLRTYQAQEAARKPARVGVLKALSERIDVLAANT